MNARQATSVPANQPIDRLFSPDMVEEPGTIMGIDPDFAPSWQRLQLIKALSRLWPMLDTTILHAL